MESALIEKATKTAIQAHLGQKRKHDGSPYAVHPLMVAFKLIEHNFDEKVVAAALMHDVLEDTDVSADSLQKEFGDEVLSIIQTVSEDKSLPWEERKAQYVESVKSGSEGVKAVSISDKIHNLENLIQTHARDGEKLWEVFNRGKEKKLWFEEEMLKMFKETWEHPLVLEYEALVEQMRDLK